LERTPDENTGMILKKEKQKLANPPLPTHASTTPQKRKHKNYHHPFLEHRRESSYWRLHKPKQQNTKKALREWLFFFLFMISHQERLVNILSFFLPPIPPSQPCSSVLQFPRRITSLASFMLPSRFPFQFLRMLPKHHGRKINKRMYKKRI